MIANLLTNFFQLIKLFGLNFNVLFTQRFHKNHLIPGINQNSFTNRLSINFTKILALTTKSTNPLAFKSITCFLFAYGF